MSSKYPKERLEWQTAGKRVPGICDDCGKQPKYYRLAIITEVSWMRGDDEVEFLCIPCAIGRGLVPHGAACQMLLGMLPADERAAIAERFREKMTLPPAG